MWNRPGTILPELKARHTFQGNQFRAKGILTLQLHSSELKNEKQNLCQGTKAEVQIKYNYKLAVWWWWWCQVNSKIIKPNRHSSAPPNNQAETPSLLHGICLQSHLDREQNTQCRREFVSVRYYTWLLSHRRVACPGTLNLTKYVKLRKFKKNQICVLCPKEL